MSFGQVTPNLLQVGADLTFHLLNLPCKECYRPLKSKEKPIQQKSLIQKRLLVETLQNSIMYPNYHQMMNFCHTLFESTFCSASLPHRLVLKLHFPRQLVDPRLHLAECDGNPVDTLFCAAVGVVGVVDQLLSHVL